MKKKDIDVFEVEKEKPLSDKVKSDKSRVVGIRFSEEEYEEIEAHAKSLGLKLAPYMRSLALQAARKKISLL